MASRILLAAFASTSLLATTSAVEVLYFYSPLKDACEWGGSNVARADNNTANGGLCAYVPSRNRLFACPAPDSNCWSWNQDCTGGTSTSPGKSQIQCGGAHGPNWCCDAAETCTTNPGQINICVSSDFDNPNKGLTPLQAQAKEFSAIPSSKIATTVPNVTPSVFSTLSPTSSSGSSSSGSSSAKSSSAAANANNRSKNNSSSSSLSGGAIAGIVIGAIAVVLAAIAIVLVLLKRKRSDQTVGPDGGYYDKAQGDYNTQYAPSTVGGASTVAGHPSSGYYGGEVYAKVAPEGYHSEEVPAEEHVPAQEMPVPEPKPQELP